MSQLNYFFPEDLFPPTSKDYGERISEGLQIARGLNLIIVGVVRDSEHSLNRNLKCIDHIGSYFKTYQGFFYENDSQDNSKKILENFALGGHIILKTEKRGTRKLSDMSLERRKNMAEARNQYVSYLSNLIEQRLLYVLIVDLDVVGGYSYVGLLNSLSYLKDSSYKYKLKDDTVIGSNSIYYNDSNIRLYYDTWAYLDKNNRSEEDKNLMVFHRGQSPFEVDSCFGGMALYPFSVFQHNIWYQDWHCDHVTFNTQLKDLGYKILLNPSQITLYNKHYYV